MACHEKDDTQARRRPQFVVDLASPREGMVGVAGADEIVLRTCGERCY
jgi:hypothetical protein